MENKVITVSLLNYKRLKDIGNKNDSINSIISKVLDEYDEYQKIKDLIEADQEFENREGIRFSSLDDLNLYLNKL